VLNISVVETIAFDDLPMYRRTATKRSLNVRNCENAKEPKITEIPAMVGYDSIKCCGVKDRWLKD